MGWKEKEWKKNKKRKEEEEDSPREFEIEMLRMQGLICGPNCSSAIFFVSAQVSSLW